MSHHTLCTVLVLELVEIDEAPVVKSQLEMDDSVMILMQQSYWYWLLLDRRGENMVLALNVTDVRRCCCTSSIRHVLMIDGRTSTLIIEPRDDDGTLLLSLP